MQSDLVLYISDAPDGRNKNAVRMQETASLLFMSLQRLLMSFYFWGLYWDWWLNSICSRETLGNSGENGPVIAGRDRVDGRQAARLL